MARKIVKKSSAKLYGDKFVKVSDTGDTQFYIRHFGHVGTEKNPKIELAVVAEIQDLENAVSEDELPEEGNFQLNITLVPYEKYLSSKIKESATEDSSSDNVLVDVVEYMGGLNYEPQEKVFFKTAKAAEKYLYSKELNDLISGHGILSGFVLDKHYNRIGQTNWEYLAYMTGESSKFEKGGSVGSKRKVVKKLPVKGFVDGGAADLTVKEKAEMYVWIDKALLREDLGSKHDLYKWFAEKFKKTAEQSEDIIDNGWAISRGAGKYAKKFAKGGGVDKFEVGDNVKIAYISDDSKNNGKTGEITWLNDYNYYPKGDESVVVKKTQAEITYSDGSVEEVSDIYREGSGLVSPVIKVGKMAKGGGVGEPKEIKKRLEYLRKELRAERISYEELAELQSLSKYIDAGDVELLQAAGVPEFDYEWLVTLKGKDGDEIDEEVEAKTEDEAMNKAEKKHEGSKALGVVQLTDDNGKIEYAKGGAVAPNQEYQLLFANQSADSKVKYRVVRETPMYLFLQEITKEPNFIFRVHKKTLSVKGIKEGKNGYQWDVPSAISLKKIPSSEYAKGGSVGGKRKIVKKGGDIAKGGLIKNQYLSKDNQYVIRKPKEIWSAWNRGQRIHFLLDHKINPAADLVEMQHWAEKEYDHLTNDIQEKLIGHIQLGQYEKGGELEGYIRFKEGITVKVDEAYLNDEASPEGASATATVMSEPSDDEELVMISYTDGSIDYVGQEWLEPIDAKYADGGDVASNEEYQLLFANQSVDSKVRYRVVRETPMYLFLQEITKEPNFIFRVHKKTLSVKGIKEGKDGYQWDVPSAISLKKIPSSEYAKGGSVGGKRKIVKKGGDIAKGGGVANEHIVAIKVNDEFAKFLKSAQGSKAVLLMLEGIDKNTSATSEFQHDENSFWLHFPKSISSIARQKAVMDAKNIIGRKYVVDSQIIFAKGGAVVEKLTEERDGDTIVLKRGKKVYAEISYNKNPDYKWTLFINPKAKSGMALSGFKSSEDAIKRANELNGEFNKAVSGLFDKGGSVGGKRKIVKKWYSSSKPDEKTYVLYDFARSEEQAKNMLRDLHEGSPIAHKSTSEGGEYNIYVKRGSVLWREKGGSVTQKKRIIKKK